MWLEKDNNKNIPIILNIKKPYAALDKFTKQDRDRNAFFSKTSSTYYNIFLQVVGYNFMAMMQFTISLNQKQFGKKVHHY